MARRSPPWFKQTGNLFLISCIVLIACVLNFSATYTRTNDLQPNDGSKIAFRDGIVINKVDAPDSTPHNPEDNGGDRGQAENNDGNADQVINIEPIKEDEADSQVGKVTTNNVYTSRDYMSNRTQNLYSWFEGNDTKTLIPDADANGTILDFVIAGFPKCGTTTIEANLGYIAPMPISDVCTPVHQTVYYSYMNWAKEFQGGDEEKLFRGTKCPAFIQGTWLKDWSTHLPRSKIIVGIRHPVLWFQSFWNMQRSNHLNKFPGDDPYKITKPCPNKQGKGCRNGCPSSQLFCMHRGRFHNALASLGKTLLSQEERNLLGPDDPDGGEDLQNNNIRNPIFLYEQNMLGEEYLWDDLGEYLGMDRPLRHDKRVNSHGKDRGPKINFCDDKYDEFRAMMMPIAYNVSLWLQDYFIPIAKAENRTDVTIPKPDTFAKLVETYKVDPCGKLEMLNNGTFVLKKHNSTDKYK